LPSVEVDGKLIEFGTMGGEEYYRVNEGDWMTKEEARDQNITPSTLPTKNKK
jgi:hypothetical protein